MRREGGVFGQATPDRSIALPAMSATSPLFSIALPTAPKLLLTASVRVPLLPLPFPLFLLLPFQLPSRSLPLKLFSGFLNTDLGFLEILGKAGMSPVFASLAFGAESREVERTQFVLLHVLVCAVRAERAEASIVMWARWPFRFRIYMQVEAVIAVGTGQGAGVVRAFGHSAQVVFMQKLACISLLA